MEEIFADLHVHIGRSENGKPIKITAARSLNFANIAKECADRKGINVVGIIDCASPYVIEDIENFLKTGDAYEIEDGGIIYKDKVCILLGSEVETSEVSRNGKCGAAHNVCFFPHLNDIKGFSNELSQHLKNMLGHLAYLMEGSKRIFDVKTYKMQVRANDKVYEGEYLYGMITNSHSVGGFKNLIGPGVEMNDGLFEVTLIKKPNNLLELNEIIAALLNANDNTDMIDAFKTDCLELHAEESISWTLDGEFGGKHTDVKIKNKKQALDILINP